MQLTNMDYESWKGIKEILMKERRKYKRWLLSSYFDTYEANTNSAMGYLADVSYGGVMLISKYPVQTSIVLPLRIELNSQLDNNGQMKIVTRSVRCQKAKDFDYYNIGLKLIDLSSSNLAIIKRVIEMYSM